MALIGHEFLPNPLQRNAFQFPSVVALCTLYFSLPQNRRHVNDLFGRGDETWGGLPEASFERSEKGGGA